MSGLVRPDDRAYHAGPWPTDMLTRPARDARYKPTGKILFFHCFLWWGSVEAYIRGAMAAGEPWGCTL